MKKGVLEKYNFNGYGVRIRRRGEGKVGKFDSHVGPSWILEHKEPGDNWRQMSSAFNTLNSAQWQRYSVWGGPRPV